jgi:hypothetical protein
MGFPAVKPRRSNPNLAEKIQRRKTMNLRKVLVFFVAVLIFPLIACSPKIHGTVQLVDQNMAPLKDETPEGTVVNMINTSVSVEEASHSATADAEGKFESEKGALKPGAYKVETRRIGYVTDTTDVNLGRMTSKKLDIKLQRIPEGKRRSIGRSESDEDKIINPGEVNIQPPVM